MVAAERVRPGVNGVRLAKQMARALVTLPLEHEDVWQVQGIVNATSSATRSEPSGP